METGLPPGKYYEVYVKLTSSFHIIMLYIYNVLYMHVHYNAGAGCEEVTLKNHGNNFAWKSLFLGSILNGNFFVNPFSSDAYRPHNTLKCRS